MTDPIIQHNKLRVWEFWKRLDATPAEELGTLLPQYMVPEVAWHGFRPFNDLVGHKAVIEQWWRPLHDSFAGLYRDVYIFMGGTSDGQQWVCGMGCFRGTLKQSWLGIPAHGKPISIRFGEFCRIEGGMIVENYMLLDLVDVMLQAGLRVLPPSPGDETYWPRPFEEDGVLLSPQDDNESLKSLQLVEGMIGGLNKYNGVDPSKMNQLAFWSPEMHWYGPVGIGSSRNRAEYERNHQTPFLRAFPDRKGSNDTAQFAEGHFVSGIGWPCVTGTHLGEYLGVPATGKKVGMRVADWWRRKGDRLVQNWVFIDLPDLFLQMGVDLFERMREQAG